MTAVMAFPMKDTITRKVDYYERQIDEDYHIIQGGFPPNQLDSDNDLTHPSYPPYFLDYLYELGQPEAQFISHYDPYDGKSCYPELGPKHCPKPCPPKYTKPCPCPPQSKKPCCANPCDGCPPRGCPEKKPCPPRTIKFCDKLDYKPCCPPKRPASKCCLYKCYPRPSKPCRPPRCKPRPSSPCPQPCPEYEPCLPILPVFTRRVPFGYEMKKQHFFLDVDWAYFNQANHGCMIKEVMRAQIAWKEYVEQQPTKHLKKNLIGPSLKVKEELADFMGCDHNDLFFAQNTTGALHAVLHAIDFTEDDEVVVTNFISDGHLKCFKILKKEKGIVIKVAKVPLPFAKSSDVVKRIEAKITKNTKLVYVDHICPLGAALPVKDIITVCRNKGIQVLVNGAQCLGPIPLDMKELDPDYYMVLPEQWLGNGKGYAILYVSNDYHDVIQPFTAQALYCEEICPTFISAELMDYSAFLSIGTALAFWNYYGVEHIRKYMIAAAREAGRYLADKWGTKVFFNWKLLYHIVMVELPDTILPGSTSAQKKVYTSQDAQTIEAKLRRYKIEVQVVCINDSLFVLLSMNIYHCKEDYQYLGKVVNCIRHKQDASVDDRTTYTISIQKVPK